MKKATSYCIIVVMLIFGSCNSVKIDFKPGMEKTMPEEFQRALVEETETYYNFFSIHKHLHVSDTFMAPENGVTTGAQGGYEFMMVNNYYFQTATVGDATGVFDHELFHTLRPEHFSAFENTSLSFGGLVCYVGSTSDKNHLKGSVALEEAGAEVCAATVFGEKYHYSNIYRPWSSLMMGMIDSGFIIVPEIVACSQTNDVPLLVGKILNKKRDAVTEHDIYYVIKLFVDIEERNPLGKDPLGYVPYIEALQSIRAKNEP